MWGDERDGRGPPDRPRSTSAFPSAGEGGRGLGDRPFEGDGEPAILRRACASRKAATDMRCCDESEYTLSPRGRGVGVAREMLEVLLAGVGEEGGMTWRNDLRLNEESPVSSMFEVTSVGKWGWALVG